MAHRRKRLVARVMETPEELRRQHDSISFAWSKLIDGMRMSQIEVAKMAGEHFTEHKDEAAKVLRAASDKLDKEIEKKSVQRTLLLQDLSGGAMTAELAKFSKRKRK